MLKLPSTTVVDVRIPKSKFLDQLPERSPQKALFREQVSDVHWRHKLSPGTCSLAEPDEPATGKEHAAELEIFEVVLSGEEIGDDVLRAIDAAIPYPILYLLRYPDGGYKGAITYKETTRNERTGDVKTTTVTTYRTERADDPDAFELTFAGETVDEVYEKLVRQVAGHALRAPEGASVREAIDRGKEREKLEKKLQTLRNKRRAEMQVNRQMAIYKEMKAVERQLEAYNNEGY